MKSGQTRTRWVATEDGHVLAESVRIADSFMKRLVGLQFARSMPMGEVLWLANCHSIHTAWMRFSIDLFFLDEAFRVIEVRRGVPPWRIVRSRSRSARHVVEAMAGGSRGRITTGLATKFEDPMEQES